MIRRGLLLLILAAAVGGLNGCAVLGGGPVNTTFHRPPPVTELTRVPFYPQKAYQCGPASLAEVLDWSGESVTPDQLTPYLYIPKRKGSLQPEMLAQARAHGRFAYVIPPHLDALADELRHGTPVLVLQNLGLSWYPAWHYAVVIGMNGERQVILRSGTERRHLEALSTFARTWQRGKNWAMVAVPPGKVPTTATPEKYLEAAAALETAHRPNAAIQAYRGGLRRWPGASGLGLALGNALYNRHDLGGAEKAYRNALAHDTRNRGILYNNLALVLADQGRWRAAEKAAKQAVSLGGPFAGQFSDTLKSIQRRAASAKGG